MDMNIAFLIVKVVVVAFFLVMFLRSSRAIWGIGLLTVTSAILLDTFLGTFGREEMIQEFGFFFYVMTGALFAGGALWMWGLLRPLLPSRQLRPASDQTSTYNASPIPLYQAPPDEDQSQESIATDRKMLFDLMHDNFGPEEIRDLVFDMGYSENEFIGFGRDINSIIITITGEAEKNGQLEQLALAVERILTPIPPGNLPRLSSIQPDSPRTVLRHYLLANYSMSELSAISEDLEIDWELLPGDNKGAKARNMLLYLYRRNRIEDLIELLQNDEGDART